MGIADSRSQRASSIGANASGDRFVLGGRPFLRRLGAATGVSPPGARDTCFTAAHPRRAGRAGMESADGVENARRRLGDHAFLALRAPNADADVNSISP